MKWFGVDEIRNLDEVQDKLPFIKGFSFGPFVPYYLYHFFHNIWDFYILQMAVNFVMAYLFLIGYYIFYFYAIFKGAFSAIKNLDTENGSDPFDFLKELLGSYLTTFLIIIIVVVFVILAVEIGLKIYAGKHSRKLSWNRCEWQSYEAFEQGEKNWHIVGLIFFILQMLSILLGIILIIAGIILIKTYLPSLKEMLPTGLQSCIHKLLL
jgi:flagellar biosynthesis protein FlhB